MIAADFRQVEEPDVAVGASRSAGTRFRNSFTVKHMTPDACPRGPAAIMLPSASVTAEDRSPASRSRAIGRAC